MIMDEPTNGLDIPSKSQFRRLLIDQFQPERSFLISTHQVHDLQGLIDSVMVLSQGRSCCTKLSRRWKHACRSPSSRKSPGCAVCGKIPRRFQGDP